MKKILPCLALTLATGFSAPAFALPVTATFTLNEAFIKQSVDGQLTFFADTATATGTLEYDTADYSLVNWSITVGASVPSPPGTFSSFTYTNTDANQMGVFAGGAFILCSALGCDNSPWTGQRLEIVLTGATTATITELSLVADVEVAWRDNTPMADVAAPGLLSLLLLGLPMAVRGRRPADKPSAART
jgi:hypothetical protein